MKLSVEEVKKSRKKDLLQLAIIIVAILLVIVTTINVLDFSNKINQGKFRIHELAIMSSASATESGIDEGDIVADISNIKLNISQENLFTIYVAQMAGEAPSKVYITNVECSMPNMLGNIYVYADKNSDNKINLKDYDSTSSVNLNIEKLDDEFGVSFYVTNENVITDAKIPDGTEYLVYDGRLFGTYGVNTSQLTFDFSCDLIVVDSDDNAYKMKLKYKLPNSDIASSGVSIVKKNTKDLFFKVMN